MSKNAIKQSNERMVVVDCPTLLAGEIDYASNSG